jgi:hypothetical protein
VSLGSLREDILVEVFKMCFLTMLVCPSLQFLPESIFALHINCFSMLGIEPKASVSICQVSIRSSPTFYSFHI